MEIRIRGYRSRRSLLTWPRVLLVLVLLGLALWKLGPRLRARKTGAGPQAAAAAAVSNPSTTARPGPPAQGQPPPPPGQPGPATQPPVAVVLDEVRTDIKALGPVIAQSTRGFDAVRVEVSALVAGAPSGLSKLHDYPYKVQLLGAAVDHVPVRSLEARGFQTRYTRILYDASRVLADLLRVARKGGKPPEIVSRKETFDQTGKALQQFDRDWAAFAKKYQ